MNIIERIKKHPIATAAIFGSGVIIGLSTFTQAIGSIADTFSCLPSKFGLDDELKGSGKLTYKVQEFGWVKVGEVTKDRSTGNHHCSRNCKGEPTRTGYSISVSVDEFSTPKLGDKKLVNPKLSCISGPCGFSQSHGVKLTGESKVEASFDVWSNPTTWRVIAEVFEYQVVSERESEEHILFSESSLLTVKLPNSAVNAVFEGKYDDDKVFSFNVGSEGTDVFSLASNTASSLQKTFKYKVTNTKCI